MQTRCTNLHMNHMNHMNHMAHLAEGEERLMSPSIFGRVVWRPSTHASVIFLFHGHGVFSPSLLA